MSAFFAWDITGLEVYQAIMLVAIIILFQWVLGWIFPQVVKTRETIMKAAKGIGKLLDHISTPTIAFLIVVGIFVCIREFFTTPVAIQGYKSIGDGFNTTIASLSGEATSVSANLATVPAWLWGLAIVIIAIGVFRNVDKLDDDINKTFKKAKK